MALTQITEKGIKDGEILNADINASAAIAGTKISPDFGSQAISTTGTGSSLGRLRISNVNPYIELIDTNNDSDFSIRAASGKLIMRDDTNSAARLSIDSTGNVGIGTASPVRHMHLNGSDSDTVQLHITNSTTGTTGSDGVSFALGSDESLIINQRESNHIALKTADTERMRIDSAGSVIIGDDASDKANGNFNDLVVGKADSSTETHGITIVTGSSATNGGIAFSDGSNGGADAYRGMISYHHNDNHMQFRTNAVERMRILASGNVGIGGNAPNYQLHVVNGIGVGAHGFAQQLSIGNNSIQSLLLGTGYTNLSLNALGGNVGIKTSSPIGTLDVHDGSFVLSKPNSSGNERNWRFLNNNVAAGNLGLQVSTAAGGSTFSNVIEITKTGQVGIGTGSPATTLDVKVNSSETTRTSENTVLIKNGNNGANTSASLLLQASNTDSNIYRISTQKHAGGTGSEFHLDKGSNAILQISGDHGDIKFGVGGTMINTFTPGLGNTTTGMGIEPRNGSIFLSRSSGAVLYCNTNTDGSQLATFRRNGNEQGKIIAHSSSVSYETTSDYRLKENAVAISDGINSCLLYTSPSPRDLSTSRMPSSA